MKVDVQVKIDPKSQKKLIECTDKQLYAIARKTLDMSIQSIPRNTGNMSIASSGYRGQGVIKMDNGYRIGSDTDYASKVWLYPDNTNWTTPNTTGKWYLKTWSKNRPNIVKMAIAQNKLR